MAPLLSHALKYLSRECENRQKAHVQTNSHVYTHTHTHTHTPLQSFRLSHRSCKSPRKRRLFKLSGFSPLSLSSRAKSRHLAHSRRASQSIDAFNHPFRLSEFSAPALARLSIGRSGAISRFASKSTQSEAGS